MGSVVLVSMGARWHLVVVLGLTLLSTWARVSCLDMPWSTLSLMSSQASKRSADEATEAVEDEMDVAASDAHYDTVPHYSDYSEADSVDIPESRGGPLRRRRKYNRLRRRKNRYPQSASEQYDNLVVPSTDFHSNSVDSLPDNQFYDRDSSYQAPSSGYNSPESSYSSPNNYEAPSYYDAPPYKQSYGEPYSGGGKDSFNDFLNALAAFLPIGLFLAAIPPNLIVINSRRKREAEDTHEEEINSVETYPFLEKIDKIGLRNLKDSTCQKELFCEMTVMGDSKNGNFVQKFLASVVKYTPDFLSDKIGVKDVFQASSRRSCEQFKCVKY